MIRINNKKFTNSVKNNMRLENLRWFYRCMLSLNGKISNFNKLDENIYELTISFKRDYRYPNPIYKIQLFPEDEYG